MPFDGNTFGSEVLRLLRRARDRIANGQWAQGVVTRMNHTRGQMQFCTMGAILCDNKGEQHDNKDATAARMLVASVIKSKYRWKYDGRSVDQTIVAFNDDDQTREHDVTNVLTAAVKLCELEELGTTVS